MKQTCTHSCNVGAKKAESTALWALGFPGGFSMAITASEAHSHRQQDKHLRVERTPPVLLLG